MMRKFKPNDNAMNVLVACEFSGIVRDAFTRMGHYAMSCDLDETISPGRHHQGDVREILYKPWDLIVAHPPCTDLAVSGSRVFPRKIADGSQQRAIDFFMEFTDLPNCQRVCIEQPITIMSTRYRKPDQIIQPFWFGDPMKKSTSIWLKGLPKLVPTNMVEPIFYEYNSKKTKSGKSRYSIHGRLGKGKGKERSVFHVGTADAMASQWSF